MKKNLHHIQPRFQASILLFFFFATCVSKSFSQSSPAIEWQKSLGGSSDDIAYWIQQTYDGGFIVAGYSNSTNGDVTGNHGNNDYWVVKLDSTGDLKWQKCLGGTNLERAYSIQQTVDGGYIVAGESLSTDGDVTNNHGGIDYWIVKLDTGGNITWQKALGGSLHDNAYSVEQTNDGGFVVAGYSYSSDGDVGENNGNRDYWVVKLDEEGNITWQKSYGGSDNDEAYSIRQTLDNGYIVCGFSKSNDIDVSGNHGEEDYWIVKLDSSGSLVWQKSLGGLDNEEANSIQQTVDGGYIIGGFSESNDADVSGNHGSFDFWIVKTDTVGTIEWEKSLGGSDNDKCFSIQQTADGGYIAAGHTYSIDGDITGNHNSEDFWTVKLDSSGNIVWEKALGGTLNDYAKSIEQTTDGGFIVAGVSSSNDGDASGNHGNKDYWVVKLSCSIQQVFYADADSDGFGNPNVSLTSSTCSAPIGYVLDSTDCDDTNPNVNPHATEIPNNGIDDNCNGVTDEFGIGINEITTTSSYSVFPNPASSFITIQLQVKATTTFNTTITITDVFGKTVFEKNSLCINGNLYQEISLENKFPAGMYLVKVNSGKQQWIKSVAIVD